MRESEPPTGPNLLLYSLADFQSLIEPVLEKANPKRICEIGVEKGRFTRFLLQFSEARNCAYTGIDPDLEESETALWKGEAIRFRKGYSLPLLRDLPPQDIYFIDGDHNYYTVKNELRLIFGREEQPEILFLHDVSWPCGRRDLYYNPENIPESERHPCSDKWGAIPGKSELQKDGYSGQGNFFFAKHEGGEKNGVLTAIEDHLKSRLSADWKFFVLPVIFGLGILYNPRRVNRETAAFLDSLESGGKGMEGVLKRVEGNRMRLYLEFERGFRLSNRLLEQYQSLEREYATLMEHNRQLKNFNWKLRDHTHAQSKHNKALAAQYRLLKNHSGQVREAYEALKEFSDTVLKKK